MLKPLIFIVLLLPQLLFAADIVEGKDFQIITNPSVDRSHKGPIITEFFSYGCPWCFKIEPQLQNWVTQNGQVVKLNKVPVVFHPGWDLYAKAFYTAKLLALSDKMSPLLFKAIQEDKKILNKNQAMIDFFIAQGVDKDIVDSAFNHSPTIDMYITNGTALMAQYQVSAIPAFVINNKYKTDLTMAGSPEHLFEIINYLLKRPA